MRNPQSIHVVSTIRYRLGVSECGMAIELQHVPFGFVTPEREAGQGKGWNGVLERTRRSAEAHRLISRYFSF